ncbi:MAG: hypothetical protein WD509_00865 [Candidatus Paceibacterota bacterium]
MTSKIKKNLLIIVSLLFILILCVSSISYYKNKNTILLDSAYEKSGIITNVNTNEKFFVLTTNDILDASLKIKIRIHFNKKTHIERADRVTKDDISTHENTGYGTESDITIGKKARVYFIEDGLKFTAIAIVLTNSLEL